MLGRDYLCSWGFSWVPFFFMLAGPVLPHARLSSSKQPDSAAGFVAKRAATIYPLYSAGLAAALLLRVGQGRQLPEWWALPARSLEPRRASLLLLGGRMARAANRGTFGACACSERDSAAAPRR